MYYLAFLVLIAGGFAASFSSSWPVYYSNYTRSPVYYSNYTPSPVYYSNHTSLSSEYYNNYTVGPSSSSSATTTSSPPPNNSSVTLKEPEAVTNVTPAAIPRNNTALGVISRSGRNIPDLGEWAFVYPVISWINYLTELGASASIFVMRIVTILVVITTFISLLCSYTSQCWAAFEGLQVKEVVTYYKTIHTVLKTMENIFARSNGTHHITIDGENYMYKS